MAKIRQSDIYPGAVSFTKSSSFSNTTTVAYAQSNLTKTTFSIGTVQGMATTDPIAIKELGTSTNTDWADEQDWTAYNQSFTTNIQVPTGTTSIVDTHSTNASISTGDLVGVYGAGSWSTSGALSVARRGLGAAGSQGAALVAGGETPIANITELFNGSTWSTSGSLSQTKSYPGGAGSQGAALVAGGNTAGTGVGGVVNVTELFNGSTWSTSGSLSVARYGLGSAGSQNAALVAGGNTGTSTRTRLSELFNGSTWSTTGALLFAVEGLATCGSQNAAIAAGGAAATISATQLFNGSTWSTTGVLSASKYGMAAAGSQNAALVAGGFVAAVTNVTELFNGSTWFASSTIGTARQDLSGAGSQSAGLITGGDPGGGTVTNITELHNQTLYRKITNFSNYISAKNVGIAFDVTSTTLSVKFNGYVDNINVTSSNLFVTASAATWVNQWVVFPKNSPNQSITDNPASIVVKSSIEADDLLVGIMISRTQMQVFSGNLFSAGRVGGW